jgi:cytochrome c oxidase subunit III
MLWFGIISMVMMFAGLTSAYVVSKNRPDWISGFELPASLYWSTLVIILSSITLFWQKEYCKR